MNNPIRLPTTEEDVRAPAPVASFNPNIRQVSDYVEARKRIIAAREGFFFALRNHLRPEMRTDAKGLADGLWNSPARQILDDDWIANPGRGYLTIRENLAAGRSFRISVLQMGRILRVGVRVPKTIACMHQTSTSRLSATFPGHQPIQMTLSSGDVMFDWNFEVPDLYDSALTMETTIFMVGSLFENSLQTLLMQQKPEVKS